MISARFAWASSRATASSRSSGRTAATAGRAAPTRATPPADRPSAFSGWIEPWAGVIHPENPGAPLSVGEDRLPGGDPLDFGATEHDHACGQHPGHEGEDGDDREARPEGA